MNNCPRCKIKIMDESVFCPLCNSALERSTAVEGENRSVMYPVPRQSAKKLRFANRLTIFVAIIAELIAVLVNYMTYRGSWWCLLSGAGLAYACFSFLFCTNLNKSLQRKIVIELVVGQVLLIVIDCLLGFAEWSLHYGLPGVVIGVDIAMLVLMLVNRNSWIEYLYSIIWIMIDSLICMGLSYIFGATFPLYCILASGITAAIVAGIIVIGDNKASSELKRRFHI